MALSEKTIIFLPRSRISFGFSGNGGLFPHGIRGLRGVRRICGLFLLLFKKTVEKGEETFLFLFPHR